MAGSVWFVLAILLVALIFDFINGFHDAANSIATVVSTRVLSPSAAVIWAAFWNFIAAFIVLAGTVHGADIADDLNVLPDKFDGIAPAVVIHWITAFPHADLPGDLSE